MNNLLLSLLDSKVVLELVNGHIEIGTIKKILPDGNTKVVAMDVKKGRETTSKYISSDKIISITVKDQAEPNNELNDPEDQETRIDVLESRLKQVEGPSLIEQENLEEDLGNLEEQVKLLARLTDEAHDDIRSGIETLGDKIDEHSQIFKKMKEHLKNQGYDDFEDFTKAVAGDPGIREWSP